MDLPTDRPGPANDPPRQAVRVADLMRREVISVEPEASLRKLIGLLSGHRISGCPVVREDGRVVGTVSVTDLVWLTDQLVPVAPSSPEWEKQAREILDHRTVGEIMTPDVFGIGAGESVEELGRFFARTGLRRALVTEEGRLLGVVSISDLLALIARTEPP